MDSNNNTISDKETIRKANRYFFGKIGVNILLIILGAVFISLFLRQMQSQTTLDKQKLNIDGALSEVISSIEKNGESADELERTFHEENQNTLKDLQLLASRGLFERLQNTDKDSRAEIFADMCRQTGADHLFLISMDHKIILAKNPALNGSDLAEIRLMAEADVNDLIKGTLGNDGSIAPVKVKSSQDCYFYSKPFKYGKKQYVLILGADASILDDRTATLRDISNVLNRTEAVNEWKVAAINKDNGRFLYYNNEADTGSYRNVTDAGLSEQVLTDDYCGYETINNKKYYCVSEELDDHTVICALMDTDILYSNYSFALFSTVAGFIIIMLTCLIYAVIVRNDFVRRAVKTDRKILNPNSANPMYFDKSVFRKFFPLMLAGVLMMFCISLYTQTMLAIHQNVDASGTIIEEAAGKYEEAVRNHDIMEEYYYNSALAKARLVAFFLEENPSVLNEKTDLYHSYYDKDDNRVYIRDDEGNRLRSVAFSEGLQELCDINNIESISIFDDNGHTICTSNDEWYFTISHDEEAQSYPFLDILDRKTDSYVQEPMTNDLGEKGQYIGVSFDYYTKKNADGDTEYVSNYEYQQAQGEGIKQHHSMIQIGLNPEVTDAFLGSMRGKDILSPKLLSRSLLILFDKSAEHKCIFSSLDEDVGKTADELNVSPKAFSPYDYYGFEKVHGLNVFACYQLRDDTYVGTKMFTIDMYRSRWIVALITAIVSLVLILFLSGTVTLTNKEEELLYEAMSEEQARRGYDSAIINMVLPSGRSTTTVQAAARWDDRRIRFSEKSPEQKLIVVVKIAIVVLLLYIIGSAMVSEKMSIFSYIVDGHWDRGMNIFAFSACVLVLIAISFAVMLLRIPIRILAALLGARGETVGHLLLSVIKYGSALFGIFYCMYLLGIDSSRLLAGAGILSLIIGLGAQSLIKDILAGIFIVFEGEFRVGDIVTINNYRGRVLDIGLRTTKIMGVDSNIKIYNNSEISGILNMTQESSIAICKILIEYGQDIEYVETVLKRDLAKLKKENPKIMDVPEYLGISALGESGVELVITCHCSEADILEVNRYLNRAVLKIFYENNINVPFNTITLSELETKERKTIKDLIQEKTEDNDGE